MATIPMVQTPVASQVEAFSGITSARTVDVLRAVLRAARGYTRGVGFEVEGQVPEDIAGVLVTATARLLADVPNVTSRRLGEVEVRYSPGPWGWSLAERLVLDRYRLRSA